MPNGLPYIQPRNKGFAEMLQEAEAMKSSRRENVLGEFKIQEAAKDRATRNRLSGFFSGSGRDLSDPQMARELAAIDPELGIKLMGSQSQVSADRARETRDKARLAIETSDFILRDPSNEDAVLAVLRSSAEILPGMAEVADRLEAASGTPQFAQFAESLAMSGKERAEIALRREAQAAVESRFQRAEAGKESRFLRTPRSAPAPRLAPGAAEEANFLARLQAAGIAPGSPEARKAARIRLGTEARAGSDILSQFLQQQQGAAPQVMPEEVDAVDALARELISEFPDASDEEIAEILAERLRGRQ